LKWLRRIREEGLATGPAPAPDTRPLPPHARQLDTEEVRRFALRRHGVRFLIGLAIAAELSVVLFGVNGYRDWQRLRREAVERRAAVALQREKVVSLERLVDDLGRAPYARERIAREELGLVGQGEIHFLLPGTERVAPGLETLAPPLP
jgi:cell division protein FtsB